MRCFMNEIHHEQTSFINCQQATYWSDTAYAKCWGNASHEWIRHITKIKKLKISKARLAGLQRKGVIDDRNFLLIHFDALMFFI